MNLYVAQALINIYYIQKWNSPSFFLTISVNLLTVAKRRIKATSDLSDTHAYLTHAKTYKYLLKALENTRVPSSFFFFFSPWQRLVGLVNVS